MDTIDTTWTPRLIDAPRLREDWTDLSWTVLVLYETVLAVYGWDMTPGERKAAESYGERFAAAHGLPMREYRVNYRLPDPPAAGTVVDPEALGWTEVESWTVEVAEDHGDPARLSLNGDPR